MAEEAPTLTRLGEFDVKEPLGESPRATVYRANRHGQECALKVLKDGVLPKNFAHRTRLVQILQRLPDIKQDNVVKVLSAGEADGRLYVAMELVPGPNLAEELRAGRKMGEREIVALAKQVAQALDAGRGANLPHGGVDPSNIWHCGKGKYKISDFAVRKFLGEVPRESDLETGQKDAPEVASAEELLRKRTQGWGDEELHRDIAALAALMMRLLGADVPAQVPDQSFEDYRDRLQETAAGLHLSGLTVSVHTISAVRQMLSPGACRTARDVVVELASALVFQRRGESAAAASALGEANEAQIDASAALRMGKAPDAAAGAPGDVVAEAFGMADVEEVAEAIPAPGDGVWVAGLEGAPAAPMPPVAAPQQAATQLETAPRPTPAAEPQIPTTLNIQYELGTAESFTLKEGEQVSLGRDPDMSQIAVADGTVSRRHCTFSRRAGAIWVKDEGSSNGTFVNEVRVQEVQVGERDVVRIGHSRISVGAPLAGER